MATRRRAVPALAATAAGVLAVTTLAVTPAAADPNPNNGRKMAEAVTIEAVEDHLQAFQEIASANGDTRASGTPGYEASAAYIEEQLQAAGYETERQYFEFTYEETLAESLDAGGEELEVIVMSYSPNTPEGGVTAPLVQPATLTGCNADEWGGVDATGKIALISRGACTFASKSLAAAAAGAEAAIVYNNVEGPLNGTLGGPDEDYVPTGGVSKADGQALVEHLASGGEATLELRTISEVRETFNVLAETAKGRDDNVVMLGAHLDSTVEGPGINDNATGSAAILETAIQLAEANKLNNKVRFAWWGAEEKGLVGSWHYVDQLEATDPDGLEDIATYLNFDMVGSPNYIIGVYDADESTHTAPDGVTIPEGSAAAEEVFTDWFDEVGQDWVDTQFSGRSDYQPFIENGIPSSGLFTGADGVKTEEEVEMFGGTAGITYDPNYHTFDDDIDNVDLTALDIMSDAIAQAAVELAQDTSSINGERSAGKSGKPHPRGALPAGEEDAA